MPDSNECMDSPDQLTVLQPCMHVFQRCGQGNITFLQTVELARHVYPVYQLLCIPLPVVINLAGTQPAFAIVINLDHGSQFDCLPIRPETGRQVLGRGSNLFMTANEKKVLPQTKIGLVIL